MVQVKIAKTLVPVQLEILLHYHHATNDFRDGDFSAPIVGRTLREFIGLGLLELAVRLVPEDAQYQITPRGRCHVQALCCVPLPEVSWQSPVMDFISQLAGPSLADPE